MFKRILVPLDGSPTSNRGLDAAVGLARSQRTTLHFLHVLDEHILIRHADAETTAAVTIQFLESLRGNGQQILKRALSRATKRGVRATSTLIDNVTRSMADVIIAQARKCRADLIVMGTHGRRGITRLVMGSTAEGVVRGTPVPVLLVRAAARKRR